MTDMKETVVDLHPEVQPIVAELAAMWPQLDWLEVLGDLSHTMPPGEVAEWLLEVGCDPVAVRRYILDEPLDG